MHTPPLKLQFKLQSQKNKSGRAIFLWSWVYLNISMTQLNIAKL